MLKQRLVHTGNWLFRWRSYLPLIVVLMLWPAFKNFRFFMNSHMLDELWETFCLGISFLGLAVRIYTIGYVPRNTSGRNTRSQVADTLNTTGIYSLVRNPLYLGNFLIWMGVSLYLRHWWFTLLIGLLFVIYHERIILAEEEFLAEKFGQQFRDWASVTPAFIPQWKNWKRPNQTFCWRTALKREYLGFFGIVSTFTLMEAAGHYMVNGRFLPDPWWIGFFGFGLLIFVAIRILRKTTKWLEVQGR
jgi:protein-S-isoprenylcysteine O-methyltransferase Ste14